MKAVKKLFGRKKKDNNPKPKPSGTKNSGSSATRSDGVPASNPSQITQAVSASASLTSQKRETEKEGVGAASKDFTLTTLTTDSLYSTGESETVNPTVPTTPTKVASETIPEDSSAKTDTEAPTPLAPTPTEPQPLPMSNEEVGTTPPASSATATDDASSAGGEEGGQEGDSQSQNPTATNSAAVVGMAKKVAARDNEDAPHVIASYDAVPVLEQTKLPRGGVSVDTKAVGRVQFGIPPETIKDSMNLGIPVPQVYIVPVDRFCREMGPALGVNLAEFEFPAYFNFFVYGKQCMLVVDSEDAEENIRRVFSETLLGPAQFRREQDPIAYEEEDFSPDFPREAIPNFQRELKHFRIMPDGKELVIETLINFNHFETRSDGHEDLGVPPPLEGRELKKEDLAESSNHVESEDEDNPTEHVPKDLKDLEKLEEQKQQWTFSRARFMGDVAVVFPFGTTEEQKKSRSVPRVEIFKMPGGTEYIVHDIDVNNHIIGKARLSGHVRVSEAMSVDGFGGHRIQDDLGPNAKNKRRTSRNNETLKKDEPPKNFHPPSFGVTILGNSHGFDKSGSVSGYVLWVNGRGVMIDPPPYSSATLEREGIRPRTIVGIILTHCHADHDAGAFQKVLTGSPVVLITTPTIYKSFIRKYAALSALSPALLRHSHRYKPAIIGQPLRFQGATFHFTYSLHTIPCVGFRVEWRGRSMVFTGDHFNSPPGIEKLENTGVLTKGRADDLRNLPLQDTDLLLHEAGAPPIHTPLQVLLELPEVVKKRLYVVHTAALPEGCELKAAPTGTAGTIRLDQSHSRELGGPLLQSRHAGENMSMAIGSDEFLWQGHGEYETYGDMTTSIVTGSDRSIQSSFANMAVATGEGGRKQRQNSVFQGGASVLPPLVSLRPASSTDAWYILNLLSAVPFLSSLSYTSTMEVLETAKVDAYSMNSVVIPAARRSKVLCVIWEGTCAERKSGDASRPSVSNLLSISEEEHNEESAIWHAGDWTGPIALQPEKRMSGESKSSADYDVVAVSSVGVKVITIEFSGLHFILKSGSPLYRKYLDRMALQERAKMMTSIRTNTSESEKQNSNTSDEKLEDAMSDLNVLELLNCNSALRKLSAVQKRHLESLAEGPISFAAGERLWRAGAPVDRAYLLVSGTASFVPKRRNAGSAAVSALKENVPDGGDPSVGDSMRVDAMKAIKELGVKQSEATGDEESMSSIETEENKVVSIGQIQFDSIFSRSGNKAESQAYSDAHDYEKLSKGLQKRAEYLKEQGSVTSENMSEQDSHDDLDSFDAESESQLDYTFTDENDPISRSRRSSVIRRRSTRARHANKVLGRLYSRRAFTGGLVFSRGHFLGDISKMVAGLVTSEATSEVEDEHAPSYGFGDEKEGNGSKSNERLESITELVIHEQEGDHHIMHSSTLTAGKDGCVVLVFPKSSLIPFLDEFPGLLLSLLGTQVVV